MLPRGAQGFGPGWGSLDLPSSGRSDGEFGGDCGGVALVTEEGEYGLLVKTLVEMRIWAKAARKTLKVVIVPVTVGQQWVAGETSAGHARLRTKGTRKWGAVADSSKRGKVLVELWDWWRETWKVCRSVGRGLECHFWRTSRSHLGWNLENSQWEAGTLDKARLADGKSVEWKEEKTWLWNLLKIYLTQ